MTESGATPPPPAPGTPAVRARGVSKRYGATTALDDVSLTIEHGESHALVGRNGAGKSTLVSILTGLQAADAGEVEFNGQPAPPLSDRGAWQERVACVYQRSAIIANLSVAENLFLNRQHTVRGAIRWKAMEKQAADLLEEWDIPVSPQTIAGDLGVEARQMIEIARALSFGARFIILDEPTAQLDGKGIERLFVRLRRLTEQGVSMMFISHHLEEVYEVCQTVTVYRDARHIVTAPVADMSRSDLVSAMTGDAEVGQDANDWDTTAVTGEPVLAVRDLAIEGHVEGLSFDIAPGEVVGVTGSASSGRVPLAEAIVGLRPHDSGEVVVCGRTVRSGDVPAALASGLGFVPSDRHRDGFVPGLGVGENMTVGVSHKLGRLGFVKPAAQDATARRMMEGLAVKASGPEQAVGSLSGGNQQKVVLGRALVDDPKVLVLMHPTRGVDVRSKESIIAEVDRVRRAGTGVLIVSDELDDLRPCDRLLVLHHGAVTAQFTRGWTDHEVIAAVEGVDAHV